jgi:hypothetical protein
VDLCDTLFKGLDYFVSLGPEYLYATILKINLAGVAIFTKNEKYHAVIAIAFLLYQSTLALRWFCLVASAPTQLLHTDSIIPNFGHMAYAPIVKNHMVNVVSSNLISRRWYWPTRP